MSRRVPLLLTMLLVGLCGQAQAEEEDLALEGVVYEAAHPADSMAIINGAILKPGDAYHGHVVREIGEDFAVLQPETGGLPVRLMVWSAKPKPPPAPSAPSAARKTPAARETPAANLSESEQMQEQAAAAAQQSGAALPGGLNPFGVLNYAHEVEAMAEVRRIATACAVLASMEETDAQGNFVPPTFTFERMKEMQMLPQAFEEQTGYYAYSVQSSAEGWGCEVHATPRNPNSGLRYFMVDQDGIIHAERGGPATMRSPRP